MEQSVKFNFLSRSDGSALYTLDKTVVLAAVTGPSSVRPTNRIHNKSYLDVYFLPCTGQPMVKERAIETIISECMETVVIANLHPKTGITLNIQEMQSDNEHQLLSASLNAACLAMLDASVQMRDMFAAVSVCLNNNGVILVEPSYIDLEDAKCVLVFVFSSSDGDIISQQQKGKVSVEEYNACLNRGKEASEMIFRFYRTEMEKKYFPSSDYYDIEELKKESIINV